MNQLDYFEAMEFARKLRVLEKWYNMNVISNEHIALITEEQFGILVYRINTAYKYFSTQRDMSAIDILNIIIDDIT